MLHIQGIGEFARFPEQQPERPEEPSFANVPLELQVITLTLIDSPETFYATQSVCKLWRFIGFDPSMDLSFWRGLCIQQFGLAPQIEGLQLPSWQQFYKERIRNMRFPFGHVTVHRICGMDWQEHFKTWDTEPSLRTNLAMLREWLATGHIPHGFTIVPRTYSIRVEPIDEYISLLSILGKITEKDGIPAEAWQLLFDWGAEQNLYATAVVCLTPDEMQYFSRHEDADKVRALEEYIEGQSLAALQAQGRIIPKHLLAWMKPAGLRNLLRMFPSRLRVPRGIGFMHQLFDPNSMLWLEPVEKLRVLLEYDVLALEHLLETDRRGLNIVDRVFSKGLYPAALELLEEHGKRKGWPSILSLVQQEVPAEVVEKIWPSILSMGPQELSAEEAEKEIEPSNVRSSLDLPPGLELIKEIGKGNFSIVYQATWQDKTVAVKLLRPVSGQGGVPYLFFTAVDSLRSEISILSRLEHPNVIGSLTRESEDKFLIMEEMPLGDLHSLLHSSSLEADSLNMYARYEVANQVAMGMDYLHRQGIIHADLHTSNILLRREGEKLIAKVTDFGCARRVDSTEAGETVPGCVPYLSPERIVTGRADQRGDIYSYGVVVWELSTGCNPYTTPKPFPFTEVPEEFAKVVAACVAPIDSRIESFAAVLELLKDNHYNKRE